MRDGKLNRRRFMKLMGAGTLAAGTFSSMFSGPAAAAGAEDMWSWKDPRRALTVKPVLVYSIPQRREARTWRSWGGLHSEADAKKEANRIKKELSDLSKNGDFPLEIQSLEMVNSGDKAAQIAKTDCDAILVYAASGGRGWYEAICGGDQECLFFLRHQSGPVYLWYEIIHPRLLRKQTDEDIQAGVTVHDVVVDKYDDLTWRLRALCGLVNTRETRIIAFGGPGGWGKVGREHAPKVSREVWNLDIVELPHDELVKGMESLNKDEKLVRQCKSEMKDYLAGPGIKGIETEEKYILNSFKLRRVIRDIMDRENAVAMTINGCMNLGRWVDTSPCLAFSLINDEGVMAFCESDFVVIPSGILMRYITGNPAFLNDPTYPHHGIMTAAHCSAPRRMNGKGLEPAPIVTHFESDWGATAKVLFRKGQVVTNVIPSFTSDEWVGVRGTVIDAPALDICRSQMEIELEADCTELLEEMEGFHWMTIYDDCMKEVGYVLNKIGYTTWKPMEA